MDISEFCDEVDITSLSEVDKAIAFIWLKLKTTKATTTGVDIISEMFEQSHLAAPNKSRLVRKLRVDKRVTTKSRNGALEFSLARETLQEFDRKFGHKMQSKSAPLNAHAEQLRSHISGKLQPNTVAFLEEAIGCLENGFRRAAVVLSWQGALSILQNYAIAIRLSDFNKEAIARNFLKKNISSVEHFQRIQEADQLVCFEAINLISKSVKISLTECLNRRNNCGHPNDFKIGDGQVSGHLETLHDHVFAVFN